MSVRYQSAIDDGLTEGAVCSLEQPAEADDLSEARAGRVDGLADLLDRVTQMAPLDGPELANHAEPALVRPNVTLLMACRPLSSAHRR